MRVQGGIPFGGYFPLGLVELLHLHGCATTFHGIIETITVDLAQLSFDGGSKSRIKREVLQQVLLGIGHLLAKTPLGELPGIGEQLDCGGIHPVSVFQPLQEPDSDIGIGREAKIQLLPDQPVINALGRTQVGQVGSHHVIA